jgi:predicted regulator of Ras-like GTPase activity (Roadblock/LC7/MglB family)
VPGVLGSMLCSEDGQVLAQLFPPEFDENMLKTAASLLSDNVSAFSEQTGGAKMFDFRFAKGRVVVKSVGDSYFLMFCSSQTVLNMGLLDMTISVASKNLEKTAQPVQEKAAAVPPPAAPAAPAGRKPSPSELFEKGPLSTPLNAMQTALAKFLGPMAKIIFVECVEKWLESNNPSRETLPQLISIVNQEIDDQAKSAQFEQMVSQYL